MKMKTKAQRVSRVIDATERLAAGANTPVAPPADKGRLYYDYEIPDAFFGGLPRIGNKVRWVREHLPRASRIKIGRDSAWYERDIREHLERQQAAAAAAV